MSIEIVSSAIEAMTAAAQAALPDEACGILFGSSLRVEQVVPAANVAPDPARHFEIDPAALICAHRAARAGGPALVGYFHSHPNGIARPSSTDAACAARDGRIWVILAPDRDGSWAITCWHDGPDGFEALSYAVVAG